MPFIKTACRVLRILIVFKLLNVIVPINRALMLQSVLDIGFDKNLQNNT